MGKEPNTAVSEPKKGIMSSILGFFGRLAIAPGKMLIYPVWPMKVIRSVEVKWPVKFTLPLLAYPKNWPNSFGEIGHDFKEGLRGLIKMPPKKYDKPIGMSQGTKYFSVIITSNRKDHEEGVVIFEGSKVFIGDIPYLTNEQLKEIEAKLPNISISREKNEVVIEIDDQKIIEGVIDSYGLEYSSQLAKNLAIQGIAEEIDRNFKKLAKITRGELKTHTDPRFLWDTAEKFYSKYIKQQEKSAEVVIPKQNSKPSKETLEHTAKGFAEKIVKSSEGSPGALGHTGKGFTEVISASPQSENTEQLEKSSEVVIPEQSKRSPGALKHSGTGFADTVSFQKGNKENKLKGV